MAKALVELMTEEYLEIQDADGLTAMAYTVTTGITQLAKCMIEKNKKLLSLPYPPDSTFPLIVSAIGNWLTTSILLLHSMLCCKTMAALVLRLFIRFSCHSSSALLLILHWI
ncbi:unnamed protein product [Prunus brigantina]